MSRLPWATVVVACLTLGLAPFVPEPHVVGKIRWVLGGAHGMAAIDWGDLALHGAPWALLIAKLVHVVVTRARARGIGGAHGARP